MRELLRVEDLKIAFRLHGGDVEVVRGVSLRVRPGSVVALVGESGSGKSVTAQAIMGLLPASGRITSGRVLFTDPQAPEGTPPIDLAQLDRESTEFRALRGSRMTKIFQEPMTSLSPLHTVGNQIEEALTIHQKTDPKAARAATEEMLALVGFPNPNRAYDMYPFELSGGLRQRAMIAMALINRPALLIADEPTTALDVTIQAQVLKLLKELQGQLGMAMLLITHDLGVVANMADEVVVMYHGQIMEAGTADDVFRRPAHPYLKALMAAVPRFDMEPGERLIALRDIERKPKNEAAAAAPAAAAVRESPGQTPPAGAQPLLKAVELTKAYEISKGSWFGKGESRKTLAVDRVSFEIGRGECLGLVGESGCGKTTVAKMLMRAVSADSGSLVFNEGGAPVDVLKLSGEALKRFRPKIQMVFQDPVSSLSPRMTVLDIIREPLVIHGRGDTQSQSARAQALMQSVGLDPRFLGRYPHSFSGGQRQRIGIARALALDPRLVVLDEPVSALDVSVQAQILNLLNDLKAELGLTYLFISHNLAVVDYMADRIAVMARGRIVEVGPKQSLFRQPIHPYTRSLLKSVPYPDLDRPIDFSVESLMGASDPAGWAPQFRAEAGGDGLNHIDIGGGHMVLASPNANVKELAP